MKCPYCSKEIKDTASFCGYCGKSVKEAFSERLEDKIPPAVDLKPVAPVIVEDKIPPAIDLKPVAPVIVEDKISPAVDLKPVAPVFAREKSYDASPQNFSIQNGLKQDGSNWDGLNQDRLNQDGLKQNGANWDRANRNEAPEYLSRPQRPKKKHGVLKVLLIIFLLAAVGGAGAVGFLIYNESIDIPDINPMDLIDTLLENTIYRNRVGDKNTVDVIEPDTGVLAAGNETEDTETVKSSHNSEWIDLFGGLFISVDDQAEVWADEINRPFAESAKRIVSHTDFSAIIITTDDTGGMTNRDYAAEYFNQFLRANQEHEQLFENCVLVLINVNSHDFYAVARGEAASVYNWDNFSDQLSPYLLSGDYETVVIELLEHRRNPANETAEDEEPDQTVSDSQQAGNDSSDYIYPSDSRYISGAELDQMSRQEIMLARNELYARHGYNFQDESIRDYFLSKSWYHPASGLNASTFDESVFNQYEKGNLETIIDYERQKGWRQ